MIDSSLLPCYVRVPGSGVYLVYSIDTSCKDPRYYDDNTSWACSESDNPQLLITLAELAAHFPERLI